MEFKQKALQNGLTIIGEINKAAKSAAVGFFVRTGSRDETAEINGVSHFLEHMLFKGTEKLSAIEVNQEFDNTGAQFNAFTSEENTVFYAAVLPKQLRRVTELWAELMRPALRDEDFNLEKNVIKEEIAMYKDLPSFDVVDRCRSLYFGKHPCSFSVLGSEESIDGLTAEQMHKYFTRRYAPNNIVVACAGNVDWEKVCNTVEESCGKWRSERADRQLEHCRGNKKRERLEKANLAREHICLMSEGVPAQDERRFAASLLGTIVGDDVGSRYYWELVDPAVAEAASMQFGAMDGTGLFYSYIRCGTEKVDQVLGTVNSIFDDLYKNGVSGDELTKAKNKILSALVIKNELPMGRLVDLGFNWMYLHEYRLIEKDVEAIKSVTVGQVNSLIQEVSLGDFTQFSIGPVQSDS